MIFGEISANTTSRNVTRAVTIGKAASLLPKVVMAIEVANAVISALISVLQMSNSDNRLSVRSNSHIVVIASLWPFFARCRNLWRFATNSAVSVIEKHADIKIKTGSAVSCAHKGTVFKRSPPLCVNVHKSKWPNFWHAPVRASVPTRIDYQARPKQKNAKIHFALRR